MNSKPDNRALGSNAVWAHAPHAKSPIVADTTCLNNDITVSLHRWSAAIWHEAMSRTPLTRNGQRDALHLSKAAIAFPHQGQNAAGLRCGEK